MATTHLPGRPADFCADCLAGNHHDHLIGTRNTVRGLLCWKTVAEEPRDYLCRCVQPLHAAEGGDSDGQEADGDVHADADQQASAETETEEEVMITLQSGVTGTAYSWPFPSFRAAGRRS